VLDLNPDYAVDIIDCDLTVDVEEPIEGEQYSHNELNFGIPTLGQLKSEQFSYYYCTVASAYTVLQLSFNVLAGSPKFYVSTLRRFPTHVSFQWVPEFHQQNSEGTSYVLQISQENPDFVIGKYFVGVYASDKEAVFSILPIDTSKEIKKTGLGLEFETFEVDPMDGDDNDHPEHFQINNQHYHEPEKEKTQIRISGKPQTGTASTTPGITLNTKQTSEFLEDMEQLRQILDKLPPEPNDGEGVVTCNIRLPNGKYISRRQNIFGILQNLHDFVAVHALPQLGGAKIPKKISFLSQISQEQNTKI